MYWSVHPVYLEILKRAGGDCVRHNIDIAQNFIPKHGSGEKNERCNSLDDTLYIIYNEWNEELEWYIADCWITY